MKRYSCLLILSILTLLCSCKGQNTSIKVISTSHKIFACIKAGDVNEFRSLIAHNDLKVIGKDEESLSFDLKRYQSIVKKFIDNENPNIINPNLYNSLGQLLIVIPIFENKQDSSVHEMHLELLFGPQNLFPLNKITGYDLVENNADSSDFKPYSYWKERGFAK